MKIKTQPPPRAKGFALIVTLSLMILLTVIAVGLLSLSSISLRASASGEANARAFANARLAVLMAIGELQKEVGDDRRITADASILPKNSQPHLVGAWDSWSPGMASQPDKQKPDYADPKSAGFRSWLISSPNPAALRVRDWAASTVDPKSPKLFTRKKDGFDLSAATVPMPRGSLAWAVSQENTKAKVNVAGPENDPSVNFALQVQRRPSVALSPSLKQPADEWNRRSGRVLSLSQIALDTELAPGASAGTSVGADFTTLSHGLLTDAVNGGLKTDLNLGFELSDEDFREESWSGTPNPFRSPHPAMGFSSPNSFDGQRALFKPLMDNPIVSSVTAYEVASVSFRFFAGAVPTFDHLRSFCRVSRHLYGGSSPVVAERGADHVAAVTEPAARRTLLAPSNPPPGGASTLSIRPVLNRMNYLLSMSLDSEDRVQLVLTPVISLWNPYNTRLEIEGAVAYPWMDLPFKLNWERRTGSTVVAEGIGMADTMGKQFESKGQSRQVDPYFFCELTANGDGNTSTPIQFEPGEVRVFYPASAVPVKFNRLGSNAVRTLRMRPAENLIDVNKRGGFVVSMQKVDGVNGHGLALHKVQEGDDIRVAIEDISVVASSGRGKFHYFVSLEDAARIKEPSDDTRGQIITDVQVLNLVSAQKTATSPWRTFSELKTDTPVPFGVIETFHRTAKTTVGGQAVTDLIYTTNPRNPSINHQLANGKFTVAPHFQSTLRSTAQFDTAIQVSFDGRRSFWGPSHGSDGKTHLPFFEIPRQTMLSLAGFQHADLSSSTFASAHQVANSWAPAYLARDKAAMVRNGSRDLPTVPIYDTCYLANEALWDSFFFSGATSVITPADRGSPATAWDAPIASVQRPLDEVIKQFVADPTGKPLANSRMRLEKGSLSDKDLVKRLLDPAGCARIAGHLMVDGAFNVNSTSVEAWTAQLSALRGLAFEVESGSPPPSSSTGFPRFRYPVGEVDNNWKGFRALSDAQVRTLAENIVKEVRLRGPFLSLGEFINRRVEDSNLGKNGAIQAAINTGKLNDQSALVKFSTDQYPAEARGHIMNDPAADGGGTAVGTPGFLTQADVLQSLAPVITCRSDTFTIRGYGEAKDTAGNVIARSWCEAVVQRLPEFVDPTNSSETATAALAPVNKTFGRRFGIISFRRVPSVEIL